MGGRLDRLPCPLTLRQCPSSRQVNRLHAHDPLATHLLHCLALFQARHDFWLRAVYVPGSAISGANHQSRNQAAAFLHSHPNSSPVPSRVPSSLICLLSSQPPQGTLHPWREVFGNFWQAELPQLQERPDTWVSVGTRSENGVRGQNVAVFHSFFFSFFHFYFSALESVMELLGPLPGVTCKLLFSHYITTGSNIITSGVKGHGARPSIPNTKPGFH